VPDSRTRRIRRALDATLRAARRQQRMANRWTWRRADEAAAAGEAPADRAAAGRFGPLAVAIALAAGIAVAPALDRIGVASGPRWLIAAAVVVAWQRATRWRGPLLLAAGRRGPMRSTTPAAIRSAAARCAASRSAIGGHRDHGARQ
jgi:hypothetical protein